MRLKKKETDTVRVTVTDLEKKKSKTFTVYGSNKDEVFEFLKDSISKKEQ